MVDTGSDRCYFDFILAQQLLRIDLAAVGKKTEVLGLDGKQDAYIYPADLFIRDLGMRLQIPNAYFCSLKGMGGILGHDPFLNRLSVRFSRGKFFEIEEPDNSVT